MPETEGTLSNEEKKKVRDWINEKWGMQKTCPSCGKNEWQLADHLVSPSVHYGGGVRIGGPSYPQAMLICMVCGFTFYFNAVVMGLIPGLEEKETAESGGSDGRS